MRANWPGRKSNPDGFVTCTDTKAGTSQGLIEMMDCSVYFSWETESVIWQPGVISVLDTGVCQACRSTRPRREEVPWFY